MCFFGLRSAVLVHEVKALVREQGSEALAEVVVRVLGEGHLLHSRELAVAGPDLLTGRAKVLEEHTEPVNTTSLHQRITVGVVVRRGGRFMSTTVGSGLVEANDRFTEESRFLSSRI